MAVVEELIGMLQSEPFNPSTERTLREKPELAPMSN